MDMDHRRNSKLVETLAVAPGTEANHQGKKEKITMTEELTLMDKIKAFLASLGEFFFDFSKTLAAKFYREYGPRALEIVMFVAQVYGSNLTGSQKADKARELLRAELPSVAQWLINGCIEMAYSHYMSKQAQADDDGDGVPNWKDLCPALGKQLSGCVDENGCPDMDCDGKPDK